MRSRSAVLCLTCFLFPVLAIAQAQSNSASGVVPLPLTVKNEVAIRPSQGGILMMPVRCDGRGNVYLRGYVPHDVMAAPVIRVSPEGDKATAFNLRSAAGFERADVEDFAINPRGDLLLLAYKTVEERAIVRMQDSGQVESAVILDQQFDPSRFAAFSSGEFLITGTRGEKSAEDTHRVPLTGLFDRAGKLLKELNLEKDYSSLAPSASSPSSGRSADDEDPNSPLSLGLLTGGDDGNVYIFRASQPAIVFVINPAGEIVRRLEFSGPEDGFRAETMKVAQNRIAIQFEEAKPPRDKPARRFISVFDAISGEKFADYAPGEKIGGAFACYSPEKFVFIGTDSARQFTIQTASPR